MRFVQVAGSRMFRMVPLDMSSQAPALSTLKASSASTMTAATPPLPQDCGDEPPIPSQVHDRSHSGGEPQSHLLAVHPSPPVLQADGSRWCPWGLHDPLALPLLRSRFAESQWRSLLRVAKLSFEPAILQRHTLATWMQKVAHRLFPGQSERAIAPWPLQQRLQQQQLAFVWHQLSYHCYQPLLSPQVGPMRQQLLDGSLSPRHIFRCYAEQMCHWSQVRQQIAYTTLRAYFQQTPLADLFEQLTHTSKSPLSLAEQAALRNGLVSAHTVTAWLTYLSHQQADVIVVGGGAAGVAAADSLQRANQRVVLLEASATLGGRTQTNRSDFSSCIEMGAEYLHSSDDNPVATLAKQLGFTVQPLAPTQCLAFGLAAEQTPAQQASTLQAVRDALDQQLRQGEQSKDGSVASNLPDNLDSWQQAALAQICPLEMGVDAEQLSLLDLRRIMPERTADAWLPDGLGTMVQLVAFGIPSWCNHRIEQIAWGKAGASLRANQHSWQSRAAVITVPLGLLQQQTIAFSPPLPPLHQQAIHGIQMAHYEKVILQFTGDPFPHIQPGTYAYLQDKQGEWMDVMFKPAMAAAEAQSAGERQQTIVIAYLGGSFAKRMANHPEAAIQHSLHCLSTHLQLPSLSNHLAQATTTNWLGNSGGAYTAAPPHCFAMRRQLTEPVANCLYFAGEACDVPLADGSTWATQVPGALRSGQAAADKIVSHYYSTIALTSTEPQRWTTGSHSKLQRSYAPLA